MNGTFLYSRRSGPMTASDSGSFQRVADFLAGLGMETVRLDDLEAAGINDALQKAGGNKTHAAKALGISVRTLQRKVKVDSV